MAAPTPTARQTPSGYKLPDGYQTLITFARQPAIKFWEKTIKPPGIDGKEAIDTTTMLNSQWRTFAHRSLQTLTPASVKAAYDPEYYTAIRSLINTNDTITVRWPDGSTLAFYGFLQGIEYDELVEGTMPEATLTITPTNWDAANGVEAGPTFTGSAGT